MTKVSVDLDQKTAYSPNTEKRIRSSLSTSSIPSIKQINSIQRSMSEDAIQEKIQPYGYNNRAFTGSNSSGILTIADSDTLDPALHFGFDSRPVSRYDTLVNGIVGYFRKQIRSIPVMSPSHDGDHDQKPFSSARSFDDISDPKLTASSSTIHEIELSNSSMGPSSSTITLDPQGNPTITHKSIDYHPRPPFSCTPAYIFILVGLLLVLIVGAVHTIVAMRPSFLYKNSAILSNSTVQNDTLVSNFAYSTLKPQ